LNSGTSQQDNFLTEATKRKWFEKNFNYSFSHEDALREQERLFQESAARVKAQAQFRVVTHSEVLGRRPIKFSTLVIDVEKRHPNHWQLENPYTRLGLPNGAATTLVKSQYRRLALVYHPDKSRVEGTAVKFQAVTEAYRTLMDR
jgi:DnaJ-domain-containing protein 1